MAMTVEEINREFDVALEDARWDHKAAMVPVEVDFEAAKVVRVEARKIYDAAQKTFEEAHRTFTEASMGVDKVYQVAVLAARTNKKAALAALEKNAEEVK